jgi:hypothetical protein
MKDGKKPELKCINWPKAYFVQGLRPRGLGNGRSIMLSALAKRQIPRGTEQKYTNAIAFYDAVVKEQKLEEQFSATPSPAPSDDDVDNELTGPVRGD